MNDRNDPRRPATFRLNDPQVVVTDASGETGLLNRGAVRIVPEPDPVAIDETAVDVIADDLVKRSRRRFPWGTVFWSALAGLVALGVAVSMVNLVEDLFVRSAGLGFLGAGLSVLVTIALIVIVSREVLALVRLEKIETLHNRAVVALISDDRNESRAIVQDVTRLAKDNPRLAHAREMLRSHSKDIIDGADMIRLAERELMTPLDAEARRLISAAAQRVSVITAISPRAVIDILFVLAAALRLVRQLSHLYGGRPGVIGLARLMRLAIAHLAITGGMAASDSVVQQMLGQGIAAKLSARLGEGILNGLLTARLGLAAVDVIRPLPFAALPRPALTDLARDLIRKREEIID